MPAEKTNEQQTDPGWLYWRLVCEKAEEIDSDGCTLATEAFQPCCFEHDLHWRTGYTWKVKFDPHTDPFLVPWYPISKWAANRRFRNCIKHWGPHGNWFERNMNLPWRWLRWTGTSLGATWSWMKFWD